MALVAGAGLLLAELAAGAGDDALDGVAHGPGVLLVVDGDAHLLEAELSRRRADPLCQRLLLLCRQLFWQGGHHRIT